MSASKAVEVFGMGLLQTKKTTVIGFWSMNLRHILPILRKHLHDRYIIVTKADLYSWRTQSSNGTVAELFEERGISCKRLRHGYAALKWQEFTRLEPRIRSALSGGDFDFVDAKDEPTYEIVRNFRVKRIKFNYHESQLIAELDSSLSCHIHDGYMGGIAVRNKQLERSVVEGFLQQMAMGPLRQLRRTVKIERMSKPGRLDDDSWTRLRALLLNSGMIVVRKDLRLKADQLVIKCWLDIQNGQADDQRTRF